MFVLIFVNFKSRALSREPSNDRVMPHAVLLTEFEGRTVSYGPSFSPIDRQSFTKISVQVLFQRNERGKRGSVTYSTDRENEVNKIFIISLLCV